MGTHCAKPSNESVKNNQEEALENPENFQILLSSEKSIKSSIKEYLKRKNTRVSSTDLDSYLLKLQQISTNLPIKSRSFFEIILDVLPSLEPNSETNRFLIYEKWWSDRFEASQKQSSSQDLILGKFFEFSEALAEVMFLENTLTCEDVPLMKFLLKFYYDPSKKILDQSPLYEYATCVCSPFQYEGEPPTGRVAMCFSHVSTRNFFLVEKAMKLMGTKQELPEWMAMKPIVEEEELVSFIAETIKNKPEFIDLLTNSILLTRQDKNANSLVRASNAITVLVAANVSFFARDLSGISIPSADLTDGVFSKCDFSYADLEGATINNCKLSEANFYQAKIKNLELDYHPAIPIEEKLDCFDYFEVAPCGKLLLCGANATICLFDLATGEKVKSLQGHLGKIREISFSPTSEKLVSGSDDKTIRIWDLRTGKEELSLSPIKNDHLICLGFSNESQVVCVYSESVRIINLITKEIEVIFSVEKEQVISSASLQNLDILITTKREPAPKTLTIQHLSSKKILVCKPEKTDEFNQKALLLSPKADKLVSGTSQAKIYVWDSYTGKCLYVVNSYEAAVKHMAFSPLGDQLLLITSKFLISILDPGTGKPIKEIKLKEKADRAFFYPKGGRVIVKYESSKFRSYDVERPRSIKNFTNFQMNITSAALTRDKVIYGDFDGVIHSFDLKAERALSQEIPGA